MFLSYISYYSPLKEPSFFHCSNVPWSKVAILGMVIPPFNRNPCNGFISPYYWVDDHPLLYENNGSLDPGTNGEFQQKTSNKNPLKTTSFGSPQENTEESTKTCGDF